jgi:NAD(P)H-dependent flavin oxidoreductase YrpB (nitropropane dioxygenase family)
MSDFHTPICDLLEIDVPIFLAGMGGVAYAEVCAAVSEAGTQSRVDSPLPRAIHRE